MAGPHVFGDGRLGCWIISPANLRDRAKGLRALGVTDVFLPRTATKADFEWARSGQGGGFVGSSVYEVNAKDRTADQYGADTVADIVRLSAGAADLNVELPVDAAIEPYCRRVLQVVRASMPNRRLRLNVAWRKGGFLPIDLLEGDPNLYACEQNYVDPPGSTMVPTSAADALENLLDAGVPLAKAAVCLGAAGPAPTPTSPRVCTYPYGWTPRRGVIFSDDLLVEAGLL